MQITRGQILRYTLTPQVVPRVHDFFKSGFGHIAFFMAQIFVSARLIPMGHAYLSTANIGRFGIRHVMAEAWHNIEFKKENADQIVIFSAMTLGLLILVAQVLLLILGLFMQSAGAQALPTNFAGFFVTQNPENDIAFILMDRVFGIPDFFNSCVAQEIICHSNPFPEGPFPYPFHEALRSMLSLYSIALLVIAVMIFLYFILAIVVETAQSGTPFGKRFNHVWAPVRMVVALGLLVPLGQGLNSAQWVLLYSAKWGSGFATNGWNRFVDTALTSQQTLLGDGNQMVAIPSAPPVNSLLQFASILSTCKKSHEFLNDAANNPENVIEAYIVNPKNTNSYITFADAYLEDAIQFYKPDWPDASPPEYINVVFGTTDGDKVLPDCGEIQIQVSDYDPDSSPGSAEMINFWYLTTQDMWNTATGTYNNSNIKCEDPNIFAGNTLEGNINLIGECMTALHVTQYKNHMNYTAGVTPVIPSSDVFTEITTGYQNYANDMARVVTSMQAQDARWLDDQQNLGWGGAGIWYNKIAQFNGSLVAAVHSQPTVRRMPEVMREVLAYRQQNEADYQAENQYNPEIANLRNTQTPFATGDVVKQQMAKALYETHKIWNNNSSDIEPSGNLFIDIINMIFGTQGLFDLRENIETGVHPLALLSGIGKSVTESAVRNLGGAAAAGFAGGIASLFDGQGLPSQALNNISSMLLKVGIMSLTVGFLLFYVIPFMPFIYFFFAVGGWIKGIFEAMVGVPLWALAHIRIDGNLFAPHFDCFWSLGKYFDLLGTN